VTLHVEHRGAGDRLVLVHGFTQNAGCWGPFADELAAHRRLLLVDAPGHGRSGHDDADLDEAGRLVGGAAGGPAAHLGYSMGGRMALHLALARPELVRSLVLIGATGGIDDPGERAARRRDDDALAERIERGPLGEFLDRWLAGPLFAGLPAGADCRSERLANRPAGLAASLRRCGTGCQRPLWGDLHRLAMPVLVLAGERDAKFCAAGRRLVDAIGGNATLEVQPGAGHALHLEAPAEAADRVLAFLARSRPGPGE
jgi:2-succinyl-6-hydroxy-2,4-cyclohexadiene-1-carboxylate synthase